MWLSVLAAATAATLTLPGAAQAAPQIGLSDAHLTVPSRYGQVQLPKITATLSGTLDTQARISTLAYRDATTCPVFDESRNEWSGWTFPLRPAAIPYGDVTVPAGPLSLRLTGCHDEYGLNSGSGTSTIQLIDASWYAHWSGRLDYLICAQARPLKPGADGELESAGPPVVASLPVSTVIAPLRRGLLGANVGLVGGRHVDLTFRGCADEIWPLAPIALRGRSFHRSIALPGGRHGRVRGRFSSGFRRLSGRLSTPDCSFGFTWHAGGPR